MKKGKEAWWVGPVLVLLTLTIIWGVPEAIVRIVDPPLNAYRAILFGGDPASPRLFVRDPALQWSLRPGAEVTFRGVAVEVNAAGFRGAVEKEDLPAVLVLGDSTPFGWEVEGEEAFPAVLERLLRTDGKEVRVVNASVPGYTSAQARILAGKLIPRLQPCAVILCVGNNDPWPVTRSDAEGLTAGPAARFVHLLTSHSRFLGWAAETLSVDETPVPQPPQGTGSVPRVSVEEIGDNARAVVRLAGSHGAPVLVLVPPVNLFRYPVNSPDAAEEERYHEATEDILEVAREGRMEDARKEARAWLAEEPGNHLALWVSGYLEFRAGRVAEGVRLLEESLERHPYPYSAPERYRNAIRGIAMEEGVPAVDVNAVLGEAAKGRPPEAMYLDHCHPTAEGHARIAAALAPMVLELATDCLEGGPSRSGSVRR